MFPVAHCGAIPCEIAAHTVQRVLRWVAGCDLVLEQPGPELPRAEPFRARGCRIPEPLGYRFEVCKGDHFLQVVQRAGPLGGCNVRWTPLSRPKKCLP